MRKFGPIPFPALDLLFPPSSFPHPPPSTSLFLQPPEGRAGIQTDRFDAILIVPCARMRFVRSISGGLQEDFKNYFAEMPWLAVPYSDRKQKEELSEHFQVSGIPTLVFVDQQLNLITKNGRGIPDSDPEGKKVCGLTACPRFMRPVCAVPVASQAGERRQPGHGGPAGEPIVGGVHGKFGRCSPPGRRGCVDSPCEGVRPEGQGRCTSVDFV